MTAIDPAAWHTAYSPNYETARARFQSLAAEHGATLDAWPIPGTTPSGEPLTIDVARFGPERPRKWLLITSALHGVEGFFGSAVQLAWMSRFAQKFAKGSRSDLGVALLHALNPYGFAWIRRFDADNVDLNRNFLLPGEEFRGAPPLYPVLYNMFRMTKPPRRFRPIEAARISYVVARYGLRALRLTIPIGQYDFPKGPFFGGHGPAPTQVALAQQLPPLLGEAAEVIHLDLHTGLGPFGSAKLLADEAEDDPEYGWWCDQFGARDVEACQRAETAYPTRGGFGPWLKVQFPGTRFHYATLEIGTYPPRQMVRTIVAETRAFNCGL
ncbi:MAG TPA: M14 family metallopeptidase, partial [Gemmatales bacterium]|nr:M14 family metallopeptidase [Gemmatales bacterium]